MFQSMYSKSAGDKSPTLLWYGIFWSFEYFSILEFEGVTCPSNSSPSRGWGGWWAFRPLLWAFGPLLWAFSPPIWTLSLFPTSFLFESVKIVVSNFHFLYHSQILHCLKLLKNIETCMHILFESVKIVVSIHWNILSNFHFLYHSQILHCLKLLKNIETCMHINAHFTRMHAHINHCEYTLDPPEQLSFSSSYPNYAVIKSYWQK